MNTFIQELPGGLKIPMVGDRLPLTTEAMTQLTEDTDISGVELRMLPPFIKENGTTPFWPFPGYSRLYCVVIVVSDVANQFVGNIAIKSFPRVGDNEHLPITETIYYWQKSDAQPDPPRQIHTLCQVIKSKAGLRNAGQIMANAQGDKDYQSLITSLANTAASAAASVNIVADIVMQIAGIVGKYLGEVEDRPISQLIRSYTEVMGELNKIGVSTYDIPTQNVLYKFQMAIRDEKKIGVIADALGNAGADAKLVSRMTVPPEETVEMHLMPL